MPSISYKEILIICSIRYFVLDEADKACDIEMENQIRTVGRLIMHAFTLSLPLFLFDRSNQFHR